MHPHHAPSPRILSCMISFISQVTRTAEEEKRLWNVEKAQLMARLAAYGDFELM